MGFEGFIELAAETDATFAPGDRRLCVRLFDRGGDERDAQQRTHQADRKPVHWMSVNPETSVAADDLTATAPLCH